LCGIERDLHQVRSALADVLYGNEHLELLAASDNRWDGKAHVEERVSNQHSALGCSRHLDGSGHQAIQRAGDIKADLMESFLFTPQNEFSFTLVPRIQCIHIVAGAGLAISPNALHRLCIRLHRAFQVREAQRCVRRDPVIGDG